MVLEQVGTVTEVASVAVDHTGARRQPDGRGRGRATLSVVPSGPSGDAGVPGALSSLCSTVQTPPLAHCTQAGLDVGRVDLRVVWRERRPGARRATPRSERRH
ncbi:hypothetical protein EV378_6943 [Pseudonocardia endophytica]|uniref:Uncharacterized protein n=1 Tax=Pseudonocardia endophytica TaxID=401976 RepID=A0A4R1HZA1_PSEEN|nr:hypothetical protein EV378_6943 [Pseudonocardia endophytica]